MTEQRFWKWLTVALVVCGVPLLFPAPSRFGGVFLCVLAACCAAQYAAVCAAPRHRQARLIARVGRVLFGAFVVSFVLVQGVILSGMRPDAQADRADAVLVLGARVYALDRPSATLERRLDTALAYLGTHPAAVAVLCGGQGANEPVTEAAAMYAYLAKHGADTSRVLIDDASNNTIQNIANAKALLAQRFPNGCTTAVITSDFHLARARRLMVRAGLDPYGLPAPTPYLYQRVALHLREYCSIMGLVLSGRF